MIITRHQAVLALMTVQLLAITALVLYSAIVYSDVRTAWLELGTLVCLVGLFVVYRHGWEPARYINAALLVVATIIDIDVSFGPVTLVFVSLWLPAMVLLLADYRWSLVCSVLVLAYFQYLIWQPYGFIGPMNLLLFTMTIAAIAINGIIAASDRTIAEANADHARHALNQLEDQTQALRESEARFRLIADHVDQVFWLVSADYLVVLYVNPTYERLYGQPCAALYADARAYLAMVHPEDRAVVRHQHDQLPVHQQEHELVFRVLHSNQTIRWVHLQHRPVYDASGTLVNWVGIATDISSQKTYATQIEYLAYTDGLTGLANRNRLYEVTGGYLQNREQASYPLTLLYLDLDRFKRINDTLSHDAGDMVLTWVAAQLRQCVPDTDALFRVGGDEFAVLLVDTPMQRALELARLLRWQICQPCHVYEQTLHLDVSIGVTVSTPADTSCSMLLTRADIAMYQAKAENSGVQWYNAELHPVLRERLQLESDLRHALSYGEVTICYQPIFDLRTGKVALFEALARWQHPQRGRVPPDVFLPIAEEAHLLAAFDRVVCDMVFGQLAAWAANGQHLTVSINLTAQSLQTPLLVDDLAALLSIHGIDAQQVLIEVTEHTAMHDLTATRQVFEELRHLGIRIAMDDFGSGYASLKYLRTLPFDVLKLDKAFAAGIGQDSYDEAVVRSLLMLGRGLDLAVVVEGIERLEQLEWLQRDGALLVQGFLTGKPQPPDQVDPSCSLVRVLTV